jgi:hypothetical protein
MSIKNYNDLVQYNIGLSHFNLNPPIIAEEEKLGSEGRQFPF